MLPCGRGSNSRLGSRKRCLNASDFCYEPPNHRNYPCHLGSFLEALYCACQYARALLTHTHIYHQTSPMLVQQSYQRIHQPYYTSIQDNRIRIIALIAGMSSNILSGRIGVWVELANCLEQSAQDLILKIPLCLYVQAYLLSVLGVLLVVY